MRTAAYIHVSVWPSLPQRNPGHWNRNPNRTNLLWLHPKGIYHTQRRATGRDAIPCTPQSPKCGLSGRGLARGDPRSKRRSLAVDAPALSNPCTPPGTSSGTG
eukprot:1196404-Prorocentrum_minimum.AAC.5